MRPPTGGFSIYLYFSKVILMPLETSTKESESTISRKAGTRNGYVEALGLLMCISTGIVVFVPSYFPVNVTSPDLMHSSPFSFIAVTMFPLC